MKYHIIDQFQDAVPKMYPEMVKNLGKELRDFILRVFFAFVKYFFG